MATTVSDPKQARQALPRPPSQGLRVTPLPRQRRPGLIVLGLVLILASAAVTAALFLRTGNRTAVLAVARPVAVGEAIENDDLTVVRISVDPSLRPLAASNRRRVVGQIASVALVPGTLLARDQLASGPLLAAGEAVVGVALKPGRLPADPVAPGDRVMVVLTPRADAVAPSSPGPSAANVLVRSARVYGVRELETSELTVVSLVVGRNDAPEVARAAATEQISIVQLPSTGTGTP